MRDFFGYKVPVGNYGGSKFYATLIANNMNFLNKFSMTSSSVDRAVMIVH
jgi:hypothetical protein